MRHLVDVHDVEVIERAYPLLGPKEVNARIKRTLRRPLVVVGACIGTDAHTVGIDAILNIKGFAGEKGLEYYSEIKVVNLGAQVLVPELVESARDAKADAVLVSQVVTQKDAHLHNTREMAAAFREAYPADKRPLLVVGGPRFDESRTAELGVDRIFGKGTTPGEVASYLVSRARPRQGARRMTDDDPASACRSPTAATCRTPMPTTAATSSTARTSSGCSVTSPRRSASVPTAMRASSPPTTTCSSSAPVRAGDVLEVSATVSRVGRRSRALTFEARVICRAQPDISASSAAVLEPPLVVTRATGTVVVP